jgi:DNA repair protein RecO (recombination protein O)
VTRLEPVLLVGVAPLGESGAVVRFLSAQHGLGAAYVHGARGRRLRPVLQIGNRLCLDLVARGDRQLSVATPQLLDANLAMMRGSSAIALVSYVAALAATLLPQAVPQPRLFAMADALLHGAGAGVDPLTLGSALVRFELALLDELGVGLDLRTCAATGTSDDLAYVSPRSRQAVNRAAGAPWAAKLLPLPAFLIGPAAAEAETVAQGLRLSGHFLARDIFAGHAGRALLGQSRSQMVDMMLERLQRG